MADRPINEEAEALKEAGNKLVVQKQYVDALKKYKKAASIDPHRAAYHSNMAFCYDKMEELQNFEDASRKSIDCDPNFVRGYQRLASALEKLWKFQEAMETVKKGLALDPQNQVLRKLQFTLDVKLQAQERHQTAVLKADGPAFPFFGGLPPGVQSRIPSDSAYASIERTRLPPQSKKQLSKLQSGKYAKDLEPLIQAFFGGDLRVEWQLVEMTPEGTTRKEYAFLLNAYLTPSTTNHPDDCRAPVIAIQLLIREYGQDAQGLPGFFVGMKKFTEQHTKYHRLVPQYMWTSLRLVLLQRFFREHAVSLFQGNTVNDISIFGSILEQVASHLTEEGLFKDVADVRFIMSDVCVNTVSGHGACVLRGVALGEAMEAAKNYEDAAKVYMAVSDAKIFPRMDRVCPEIRSRTFAGLAFKRAQQYVPAEEQYVAALRAKGTNWTFQDTDVENALNNMMIFYEIVHWAVMSNPRSGKDLRQIQRACFVLVGLLSIAGYRGNGGCTLFHAQNPQGYKMLQGDLKREYKTPRKAMRAIVDAFSAPTIEEYRKRLFACSKVAGVTTIADEELRSELQASLAKEPAKAKSSARNDFNRCQTNSAQSVNYVFCSGCQEQKSPQEMKECPCRTVAYCSIECQKVHWKIHKRVCPHRKPKKQTDK